MTSRVLVSLGIAGAIAAAFFPVLAFAFLNWGDGAVIAGNGSLALPGAVRWAFTTTDMEHYQPVSWLVWAAAREAFGADARAFHALNLVAHAVATWLVLMAARLILRRALRGTSPATVDGAAVAAALLFGLHPLRVEVVAWVSAFPYTLALVCALSSLVWWLRASAAEPPRSTLPALALFVASLLARPVAFGQPVALVALDVWLHGRGVRRSVSRAIPFALAALGAAAAEAAARAPGFADVPWMYRVQLAASVPFVYLWRTVAPLWLSPLDLLPLAPEASLAIAALALTGLLVLSAAAWHWRRDRPGLGAAWVTYLALLAPTAGLAFSGLQATSDRHAYFPGVVVAIAAAGAGARWVGTHAWRRAGAAVAAAALVAGMSVAARVNLGPWSDSVSLWTRVTALDPSNDVGLYNLGEALSESGRPDEAEKRYRQAVAVNPGHAAAQANLNRLDAARLEGEGNDLAARGDLIQAADRYGRALQLDPQRTHAHAARGLALVTLGRGAEARVHLEEARRLGNTEAGVANALGVLLAQAGQPREARAVFESALTRKQNDLGLALNLTHLLATTAPADGGDAALALRLATAVADATGRRDPRVVDTLAAALAANGRMADALAANRRAAELARAQGDAELALQITARGRAYRHSEP
ncbi:MAG: tetratricopeptide repeat protein [Acidobacteria bacterium]|nr:tetratricopeptide repeat protein [Acidobacteriota bacterium]